MNRSQLRLICSVFALVFVLSCTPQMLDDTPEVQPASTIAHTPSLTASATSERSIPTSTPIILYTGHLMRPADVAPAPGMLVRDTEASDAVNSDGDSYNLNRFERPFNGDMIYVPDLDILTFNLSQDGDWYYISIELSGSDPNNPIGINYGVEIDMNADGFGDYILWAHPPYIDLWDSRNVQVYKDSDHDSGGLSGNRSDAVFAGNGYDTLVFDGGTKQNADPDFAWVRMNGGLHATIQFAFKKAWLGSSFLAGVICDAGLKDVSKFDYSDRFQEIDAGSPVGNSIYYPLGSLYAVDNSCWQAYGIQTINDVPKFCPDVLPLPTGESLGDEVPTNGFPTTAPPTSGPPTVETTNQPPTVEPTQPPTAPPTPSG